MRLGAALALVALPLLTLLTSGDGLPVYVAGLTLITMVAATGLNLLYGYGGLVCLNLAGISGVSAFTSANLVIRAGMPFGVALLAGSLLATLVGLALSLPALRLRGFYFALSSLVTQSTMSVAFVYFPAFTNGDTGIASIPRPSLAGVPITSPWLELGLAVVAAASVCVVAGLMRSRFGETLTAIRVNEDLSRSIGINVALYRTGAFAVASFFAGVAGALYAHYIGFASPRSYDVLVSLNLWLMVAVGGRRTLAGPLLGAIILVPLPFLLQQATWLKDVIYGMAIIGVTMYLPDGVAGALGRVGKRRWLAAPARDRTV